MDYCSHRLKKQVDPTLLPSPHAVLSAVAHFTRSHVSIRMYVLSVPSHYRVFSMRRTKVKHELVFPLLSFLIAIARHGNVSCWACSPQCFHRTAYVPPKGRLPLISVAIVDGAAVGGGAELATCCDFRVAGPESVIRFVQVKVGACRTLLFSLSGQRC